MTTQTAQMVKGRMLCTFTAQQDNEDPVPSAARWDRCLAIEVDTPWNKEITNSASYPRDVLEATNRYEEDGGALRIQGLMRDDEYSVPGHTRVIEASLDSGAGRFTTTEYVFPTQLVGSLVDCLLNGNGSAEELGHYRRDLAGVRDILVCTHGSRDACCARFGYRVYRRLRDEYASPGSLRVWRTSHTGGHRFAPTLIDLPEGRYWAWIGDDSLDNLITRSGSIADLIDGYRGLAALSTAYEQVAEREALRREGWPWTGYAVSTEVTRFDEAGASAEVRIDFNAPNGGPSGAFAARVKRLPDIVTEGCASAELGKTVAADQYRLERFEPLSRATS